MDKDWSTKLPTEAGYFWLWFGDDITEPEIVEIQLNFGTDALEVFQVGVEGSVPLAKYNNAYWAPAGDYPPLPVRDGSANVGC